ncbi:MAG: OsmC family protein [Pseudomonadota bacterium]
MTGTLGAALDVRGIKSDGNLVANVEGDIEEVDGVLKITKIRVRYQFKIPQGTRDKAERALETYAEKCPAYQSVKGCIYVSWEAEIEEE